MGEEEVELALQAQQVVSERSQVVQKRPAGQEWQALQLAKEEAFKPESFTRG